MSDLTSPPDLSQDQPRGGPARTRLQTTPLSAVARFAAAGKTTPKKDLALQAIAYGNRYVARVAIGADPKQTSPAEAGRLAALAQEAVNQHWQVYEEMATRDPSRFPADGRPGR